MSTPTDPRAARPSLGRTGRAAPDAGAPVPEQPWLELSSLSQLFAELGAEGHGPTRTTRVIPELAARAGERVGDRRHPGASPPDAPGAPGTDPAPEFPPDVVLIVGSGGIVLYVNRPLGRRSEEEVVGSHFTDWVFPEQHVAVQEALGRVFATGRPDGVELHGIQGHDADAWFECRISPNQREGKVVSVQIVARDVTRYKHTERTLRERCEQSRRELESRTADLELLRSEVASTPGSGRPVGDGRLQEALATAGEAIFLLDPATECVVDLNETACRWLSRHRRTLMGTAVTELDIAFPLLPPVGFDVQFTETRDIRRPLTLDGEHRRQDGSTFPVEVTVIGHLHDGREYYLAVVRDVKDRRRAQEAIQEAEIQWRSLLEQSFDAVYLTTRGGEIVEANPAAVSLFGYRRDEFIGLDARTLMPDVGDIRRFQQMMAAERFVARLEATLRRRDGSTFFGVVSASRRRDVRDRLLGYQWVVRPADVPVEPRVVAVPMPGTPPPVPGRLPRFTPPDPLEGPVVEERPRRPTVARKAVRFDPEITQPVPTRTVRDSAARTAAAAEQPPAGGPATPVSHEGGVVLFVGGQVGGRREAVLALERAGFAVLDAADGTEAIRMLRSHGRAVDVAVVGGEPGTGPEDIARDLEALAPTLGVILLRPEDQDQTAPSDLPDAVVLREPVLPLALLQSVREIRARR